MSQTAPSFLADALALAGRGWRVFPLKPRSKKPQIEKWQIQATTNVEQIQTWWTQWPHANVGIATGQTGQGTAITFVDLLPAEGSG